eukprot:TRINITY_DN13737_c0_g1_i1.p1 TRINITY_DN13737_c0_g1~~TRINITY_DN13737_c0_g1_i1.p1  ORF type:complete len:766 (+),score=143.95 TRINITY_DN13737_c0_g1_i1:635-2932(+)
MASSFPRAKSPSSEGEELSSLSGGGHKRRSRSLNGGARGEHNDADGGQFTVHEIGRMDTLAGLAIKYGVEVMDIKRANRLISDTQMFAQKTLRIPLPGTHAPSSFAQVTQRDPPSSRLSSPTPGLDVTELLEACTLLRQQSLPASPDGDPLVSHRLPLSYPSAQEERGREGRGRSRWDKGGEEASMTGRTRRHKGPSACRDEREEGNEMADMANFRRRGAGEDDERPQDWRDEGEGRWALKDDERGKGKGQAQGEGWPRATGAESQQVMLDKRPHGKGEGASKVSDGGWRSRAGGAIREVDVPEQRANDWEWRSLSFSPPEYEQREGAARREEGRGHPLAFSPSEHRADAQLDDSPSPLSEGKGGRGIEYRGKFSGENSGDEKKRLEGRGGGDPTAAGHSGRVIWESGGIKPDGVDVQEVGTHGGRTSSRKLRSARAEEVAAVVEQMAARAQKEQLLLPPGGRVPGVRARMASGGGTAGDDPMFADRALRRRGRGEGSSFSSRTSDRSDNDFLAGSSNPSPSSYSSTYLSSLYSFLPLRALNSWYSAQTPLPPAPQSNTPLLQRYSSQSPDQVEAHDRSRSGLPPMSSSGWSPSFPRTTLASVNQSASSSSVTRTASAKSDNSRPAGSISHSRTKSSSVLSSLSSPSLSAQRTVPPVALSSSGPTTGPPSRSHSQSSTPLGLRQFPNSSPGQRLSGNQVDDVSAYHSESEDLDRSMKGIGSEVRRLGGGGGRDERGDDSDVVSAVVRGGRGMSAKRRSSNKLAVE